MSFGWNKENSLTGNEFLDYLSWCEVMGIDIEGNEEKNEIDIDEEQQENQRLIKKMKGRDKYE